MFNTSFTSDGIQNLLDDLDTNKATGPENVSAWVLKHCSNEIAPILSVLFTQLLTSGQIPNDWLTANVTPAVLDTCIQQGFSINSFPLLSYIPGCNLL